MSNIDPDAICEKCVHFANERNQTECRKYAPRRGGGRTWADVQKVDWCSEFEINPPD